MAMTMVEGWRTSGRAHALVLIALMLLSPISTVAANSQTEIQSEDSKMQTRESNWQMASPSGSFEFELLPSSGLIHTRLGSFDPLEGGKLVAP